MLWFLSFASGLLQVIELIIRIQVARIVKMAPWKHKIESRHVQDLELEKSMTTLGMGHLATTVAVV